MSFNSAEEFTENQYRKHANDINKYRTTMLRALDTQGMNVVTGGCASIYVKQHNVPYARIVCRELNKKGMECWLRTYKLERGDVDTYAYVRKSKAE